MKIVDYKNRINEYIENAKKTSDCSKTFLYIDCFINCALGRCTISDYFNYRFYLLNHRGKRRFICNAEQAEWYRVNNDPKMAQILNDKDLTLHHFSDFIDRDWCGLTFNCEKEDYNKFASKHEYGIFKPLSQCGGRGVHIMKLSELQGGVFQYCKENNYILEEVLKQDTVMASINPDSINTVRVVTNNGKILAAILRVGRKGSQVDNYSAGGIIAQVDAESGIVSTKGINEHGERFLVHPDTKIAFPGFVIPQWEIAKVLISSAVKLCQGIPVIGWDIAFTPKGPTFIEVNAQPEMSILQLVELEGYRSVLRNK